MKHVEDMTDEEYEALQFDNKDEEWILERATEIRMSDHEEILKMQSKLIELSIDLAQDELIHRRRMSD